MHAITRTALPAVAALALLSGCATRPVAEELVSTSAPIGTIQTEPEYNVTEYPTNYYGFGPPRQFLRGGSATTPLRYDLRLAEPVAVGERLSNHPANLPGNRQRLVATETYGLWQ